ncbi:MAG: hypothetical protein B6I30_01800 [Desulfobacteraceae bacterium 4572_187]|nr:MAG: hypothetical protein B6I30_01800 [Desulfobacteraceae bacterium 4572_187]
MKPQNLLKEYYTLLKKGLIGERDTPFNPEFIKSGYSKIMLKRYEIASSICDGRVVLDVGCGLGWGVDIVKNTASKVYGIDSDQETIRYCNGKYSHNNVHFEVMDCRDLTFQENTFDAVLLMEVIEHFTLEDGYKCINEIVKVLKPAGILTGTTYIPQTDREKEVHIKQTDNEHHLHIYTKSEMEKLLSTFFYNYEIKGVSSFAAAFPKKVGKSTDSVAVNLVIKEKKKKHIYLTTSAAPSQSLFSTTEKRPPISISKDVLPEKIFLLTVGCINYDCNINFYDPLEEICSNIINYNYVERLRQIGKKAMNDEVVSLVDKEKPDYVFFITYQDQIDIFTLDKIKMLGAKAIAWFCDDHWRFDNYSKFIAPHVFCSITTDKYAVKKYKELGLKVIKTQWGSNQNYYKKVDSKFLYDVSFVGQDYGKRRENLTYLMKKGIPLSIFGKGFGKFLEFDDIIKLFNASKINLNFSGSSSDDRIKQIKGRVFEVPMCGSFLLTEYADEIEKYFDIDKEIACFEDYREAEEKIQYYLKNEDRRLEIAKNGYVRALKDHTWKKRLEDIFNDLESVEERSDAPWIIGRKQFDEIDTFKTSAGCKTAIPPRKNYEIGFHGDSYLLNTVDHVLAKSDAFIETGAYMGDTLEYVARNFGHLSIFSCEPKLEHFTAARNKLCFFLKNITLEQAVSPNFLYKIMNGHPELADKNVAFWLDAHSFGFEWPLKDEIKFITEKFKKAYIFIDDFKIHGRPDFQYDSYANQECSWEFIRDELCSDKEYSIYLPKYREKTSRHHPLVGWVLIEFGHSKVDLPYQFQDYVIKTSYHVSAENKSRQNQAVSREILFSREDNHPSAADVGSGAINISGYRAKQDSTKTVYICKSKKHAKNKNGKHVLLVTSAAPEQSPFSTTEKRPPIGIGFLISVLRNAGHNVSFIDNYLQPSNFIETDFLQKNDIEYIGIYANTICYRDTLRMLHRLEWLRQTGRWKGKIVVGGPHATVCLDTIPEFVDYVVQGEGEQAIIDIVEGRVTKRVVKYPRIKDLDELPMPAWDYFVNLPYNWGGEWFPQKPVFTMNTSRGCPFKCTFCSVGSIWGKKYTCFSAKRIVSDIEYLIEHYGAKGIYFREDNFTLNKKRLKRFCNLLLEKGIKISWACETRVNTLDREMVELMSSAGACGFYFGVESGSQRVLDFLKKDITVEQTRNAFKLCHEFGIKMAASVVVGVPTETEAELKQTIRLLKEIKPTITWFNIFVGIPNSKLYQYTIANKLYEFIDDRGLVYLKGHNDRVKTFYEGAWDADIPVSLNQNRLVNPKISVVMSVYNGKKHLKEAVESVLCQSCQDFEFIIVNDASTDKTNEILESFDDPRIKIIKNTENMGLTKSLNIGIKAAKGKYIARMDADDISLPHRFEIQVEYLERNPECAVAGSSYYQIDDKGTICSFIEVLTNDPDIKEGLKTQNWFGHGSVMMKKDAFLKAGGYNEKYKFAQDYDLWLRLAAEHRLANIKEPLYCWRVSSSNISKLKSSEQRHCANRAISEAQKREVEKMDVPLVSVIVPTYNRSEMLTEALESILKQTFNNFEIVVVNDAGMSVEDVVLKLNKKKNITYVSHAKNRGLAAARNTGITAARGKYISLLDDDDLFYPNHLETAMAHVSEKTPVIYTDAVRATYERYNDSYRLVGKNVPYSMDFERKKLLVGNISPANCFVFKKKKALQVGLFDETLTTLEDWDFWIRLSGLCTFKHIAKVTAQVNWRTDGTTMTSSLGADFKKNRDGIYKRYQEEIKQIPDIKSILNEFDKIWKEDSNPVLPLVSIVVLTYNQISYTKKCIESIIKNTQVPFELIVVDNASTDGTIEYLELELTQLLSGDRLLVIKNKENSGFAKGNNQGIAASRADFVMLMNNDVVVTQGWLSRMIACAEKSPVIGIVGPKSNYVSGPQLVENISYDTKDLNGLEKYADNFADKNSGKATPIWRVVGFCMLIKRAVIDKIGGLDGRYGLGNFEDDDFSLRAALAGYESRIANDCFVHHFGSRTFIGEQIDYKKSLHKNWEIFKKKWGISKNLPYGSSCDLGHLVKEGFILSKHFIPVEEKSDLPVRNQKIKLEAKPKSIEAEYYKIQQLLSKGKKREAKQALENLLSDNPEFALGQNDLGVLCYQDGDTKKAMVQ